jgi:shikimate kinase
MIPAPHIFLCGFMGCGKSTHGRKLAKLMKRPFVDLDTYITERENKTIQFIFEVEGEKVFRELESKYLLELMSIHDEKIISLGGGTICFNNNLGTVKQHGILIYFEMPAAALAERLIKSKQKRPLLKEVNPEKLTDFIEEKLLERSKYYTQADISVNGLNLSLLQLQREIIEYKEKNKSL